MSVEKLILGASSYLSQLADCVFFRKHYYSFALDQEIAGKSCIFVIILHLLYIRFL